jgi:hypothetical protein
MAAPRRPKIPAEVKAKLLAKVRSGLDVEAACSELGLSPKQVQQDETLMLEINDAYRIATAKLRARLMDVALKSDDARILAQLLEKRDEARLEPPKSTTMAKADFLEEIAKNFERQLLNEPPKVLAAMLRAVLEDSPVRLNAGSEAAARALLALLVNHPPLPYSPKWWAIERAAGRNGLNGWSGYHSPEAASCAGPRRSPRRTTSPPPRSSRRSGS